MTLRSCKPTKHSYAGEDMISTLPDALLTQILLFLPEADVKQTRFLSNRWKDIWAFLPNLRLIMPSLSEEAKKFENFVDQTLALRDGMPIEEFYLYCSETCDYDSAYDWLCTVVKSKVQKLQLRFPHNRLKVKLCWNLFRTCDTLVELTLQGEFVLDVPRAELHFPCLKKINLVSIAYSEDEALMNLISGCPVLEELFVEREVNGKFDNLKMFKVASHSLKRLRIWFWRCVNFNVVIDAPNLEYMYIMDEISQHYTFTKLLSLVEAHIETLPNVSSEILLTSLSSVKILTIPDSTVLAEAYSIYKPVFNNLVKFATGLECNWGWIMLPDLLESMPNLEHITFLDGLVPRSWARVMFNMRWKPPMEVPHCLRFTMKEIIILNKEAITEEEFPLIRYLLRHSCHLETLSINAHNISPNTRDQLLRFPRGSAFCRIEFI
ncbi:hypothetical protein L2E82_28440 [Cichorium intybus]|uniref:Uncharacterized protein n=1 Tax=Cichorium intybus TaxID=13427 RepID=A0ACB9CW20_CICIN|nr:hypothetical protein L2E82_28440 [Cichorium intybus]